MLKGLPLNTLIGVVFSLLVLQALSLYFIGQPPICGCGHIKIWEGVVQSSGNSQHLTDWYTPSHVIHGFLFFALFTWLFPSWNMYQKLAAALFVEISWELIENTPMVIDHYRKQALAQGYIGDSILNSLSDSLAMIVGFFSALRLPAWISLAIIISFEIVTMSLIRDGLLLNILNLIYPLEFISNWQAH